MTFLKKVRKDDYDFNPFWKWHSLHSVRVLFNSHINMIFFKYNLKWIHINILSCIEHIIFLSLIKYLFWGMSKIMFANRASQSIKDCLLINCTLEISKSNHYFLVKLKICFICISNFCWDYFIYYYFHRRLFIRLFHQWLFIWDYLI